jgi:hypothetical protein
MRSYSILVMITVMIWLAAAVHSDVAPVVTEPPHITRGLSREYVNVGWQLSLIELRRQQETSLLYLAWMQIQEPIHFDGSIPLWGLLCGAGVFAYSFISLLVGFKAHEKRDVERFSDVYVRFEQLVKTIDDHHEEMKLLVQGRRVP